MTLRHMTLCAVLLVLAIPTFAASPQKPGEWQITTEMDMPGMPMKMPPMTTKVCLTQADIDNPERSVPKVRDDQNCKVSDYKIDGNTVSWSMKCEGKKPLTATGEIIFAGDSYTGSMKMKDGDREMSMKYSGKRTGECTKK
jgi:hypothetical protein